MPAKADLPQGRRGSCSLGTEENTFTVLGSHASFMAFLDQTQRPLAY